MGVPKYFEIHKPPLQFLSDGATHSLKEIKNFLINYFHLTDADVSEFLSSGRQTYFANRVGWARTYLKKAGLIDSPSPLCRDLHRAGRFLSDTVLPVKSRPAK